MSYHLETVTPVIDQTDTCHVCGGVLVYDEVSGWMHTTPTGNHPAAPVAYGS